MLKKIESIHIKRKGDNYNVIIHVHKPNLKKYEYKVVAKSNGEAMNKASELLYEEINKKKVIGISLEAIKLN